MIDDELYDGPDDEEEIEDEDDDAVETPAYAPAPAPEIDADDLADRIAARFAPTAPAPEPDNDWDPMYDAVRFIDERDAMIEEAFKDVGEVPAEVKAEIKRVLTEAKTRENLQGIKNAGLHTTLAKAKLYDLAQAGKHVPSAMRDRLTPEPVHTENFQMTSREMSEARELEQLLGVKFTKEELQKGVNGR